MWQGLLLRGIAELCFKSQVPDGPSHRREPWRLGVDRALSLKTAPKL
jgi:hypothetical protein